MPLCLVCQHTNLVDMPCQACGFCGFAEGFYTFAILPSALTLVNDARAWGVHAADHFLAEQEIEYGLLRAN